MKGGDRKSEEKQEMSDRNTLVTGDKMGKRKSKGERRESETERRLKTS